MLFITSRGIGLFPLFAQIRNGLLLCWQVVFINYNIRESNIHLTTSTYIKYY